MDGLRTGNLMEIFSCRFQDMGEVDYESLPTEKLSAHLIAGGAAGIMEHCFMYPVDCVKVYK